MYEWWDGQCWVPLPRREPPPRAYLTTPTDPQRPVVIVSSDTHIGPRLADMRQYCPERHVDEFDAFVSEHEQRRTSLRNTVLRAPGTPAGDHYQNNHATAGHNDPDARLRDLDWDGVAAEVLFHGSQNGEPIPFRHFAMGTAGAATTASSLELAGIGDHIYNQWLADFCSHQPERHVAATYIPYWNVQAAVDELRWARNVGLRGVNFPAQRIDMPQFNDPYWEPIWSTAEELGMPLLTHIGGGHPLPITGSERAALLQIEGSLFGRRGIHWMIFSGVFERHPGLRIVPTEMPGEFWTSYVRELDTAWLSHYEENREKCPRPPSEYCTENVFIGASFLSRTEASAAVNDGYAAQVLWGSDYPHQEGTYQYPPSGNFAAGSMTRRALRATFAGLPEREVRAMAGLNAVSVYGLDADRLAAVAERISAPTFAELSVPLDEARPARAGKLAFRRIGPWA
jgi:predicted TIM-barrel fold metal-dependent hydrolase